MSRDREYLIDLIHASAQAIEFAEGMTYEEFAADAKTQSAVIHQLLILGEAVKLLTPGLREQYPESSGKRWLGCVI